MTVPALAAVVVALPAVPAFAAPTNPGPTHHLTLTLRPAAGSVVPSAAEVASVSAALSARGLTVGKLQGLTLPVTGPAATVRSTFAASGAPVDLGSAGTAVTTAYDATADPLTMHPRITFSPHTGGTAPQNFVNGTDLRNAYHAAAISEPMANPTINSSTPVVATIQLSGWDSSNLTYFAEHSATSQGTRIYTNTAYDPVGSGQYTGVAVNGATLTHVTCSGCDDEVALDQEAILVAAPTLAQRAYIAPDASGTSMLAAFNAVLSDRQAGKPIVAVSTSWGACEPDLGNMSSSSYVSGMESVLSSLNSAGVTVFAASGDSGDEDCDTSSSPDSTIAVDYPASSPNVVGVGGTTFQSPSADTAWDTGQDEASGGGASSHFSAPSWQQSLVGSSGPRVVPDVSMDADPDTGLIVRSAGSWVSAGGTSLASPLTAALIANLVNGKGRTTGLGDIHAALYAHTGDFTDVVASTAGGTGTNIQPTAKCYDASTGLGTPNFTLLNTDLFGGNSNTAACSGQGTVSFGGGSSTPSSPSPTPAADSTDPAPTVGNPAVQISRWVLGNKTGTASLSWNVSDTTASITGFDVSVYRADGSLAGSDSLGAGIGGLLVSAPGGTAYTVAITAIDDSGVTATARSKALAMPLDDRSSKRSLGWTSVHKSGSLASTLSSSSKPGATATVTLDGSHLVVLIATAPNGGSFQLLVDGKVVKTVSTKGKSRNQVAVTVSAHSGSHRVMIRVLKAKKGKTGAVELDGFIGS